MSPVDRSTVPPTRSGTISLRDIARRFGRRWALRSASVDVAPGEVVALVGHNGSGKSTLLRVIATSLAPTAGTGQVCGFDIRKESADVRGHVGLLGHSPGLYDDLTAEENLRFAATMLDRDPDLAADVLERVGLGRERHERVRGFSSGMQRRVALARLMLQRPAVLLLDEPYNSFDAQGIRLVNECIEETRARGGAALVVVHDLAHLHGILSRVEEMHNGVLHAEASRGVARAVATAAVREPLAAGSGG